MIQNADHTYPIPSNLPAIAAAEKLLEAGVGFQVQVLSAASRLQIESFDFLMRRCQQQVRLVGDLVGSAGSNDALDVIGDFVRVAKIDYAAEVSTMLMIGSKLASEAAHRIREEAASGLNDMAARTVA
ncbi:hypothetical protein AS026_31340 [Rhizobium altiplani]|uniref:Phasin domain-containing protein n=1 Tax=Rhizobium altiplani TaxID=1864509 RepID=A0A109JXZ5_9HYPH|nr:hypothetical protein [Rhizobium altiplani]KWV57133.1 hypothetical protein AS026_31340 [Rhizobium altiplani]